STAAPLTEGSVYRVGAGRVDVARAVRQQVVASTGMLSLGGGGGKPDPVTRTVTYRNDGDHAVTLNLAVAAANAQGTAAGPDMLAVTPPTVTVPAGGTAAATVALNLKAGAFGVYSGHLTATSADGGVSLT